MRGLGSRRRLALAVTVVGAITTAALTSGCGSSGTTQATEPADEAAATSSDAPKRKTATVARVIDGDTIELQDSRTVRLLQIDAAEPGQGECYSRKAGRLLREMLPAGTDVRLEIDPTLDRKDKHGRLLRYVWKRSTNVNVWLVRKGAASVWFVNGARGKYAHRLLRAARNARGEQVGLWQACRGTVFEPQRALAATSELPADDSAGGVVTEPSPDQPMADVDSVNAEPAPTANCDSSYPDFCIPPSPPDLDCADIGQSFTVIGNDPHGFDGEDDGVGCESY